MPMTLAEINEASIKFFEANGKVPNTVLLGAKSHEKLKKEVNQLSGGDVSIEVDTLYTPVGRLKVRLLNSNEYTIEIAIVDQER